MASKRSRMRSKGSSTRTIGKSARPTSTGKMGRGAESSSSGLKSRIENLEHAARKLLLDWRSGKNLSEAAQGLAMLVDE